MILSVHRFKMCYGFISELLLVANKLGGKGYFSSQCRGSVHHSREVKTAGIHST